VVSVVGAEKNPKPKLVLKSASFWIGLRPIKAPNLIKI